ncbi:hypothetical protein JSY14_11570 [Brachybacterium sp. EF45031]|uniref:hypothetical protein n=1 Tax=Brachybacterium sillae TaxID=2810536 RepID=UPI00217DF205|nr:hypothetical protein [Brachybacterium sillae]MCS6712628.1 hypothetical protein [Brachybacterium sillae]
MGITRDDVVAARAEAARAHSEVMGDRNACARAKSGEAFPAGKFWEGKTAALGELLRTADDDLVVSATRLRDQWQDRPVAGPEGEARAYRQGGVDALTELIAAAS